MSELVIAILLGITISVTGCTKAGESSVSDYEQGGYFKEEQQIEQKEEPTEEKQEDTDTEHKEKPSVQPADSNTNNNKVNNNTQNNNPVQSDKKVNDENYNNDNVIPSNSTPPDQGGNSSSDIEHDSSYCPGCGASIIPDNTLTE